MSELMTQTERPSLLQASLHMQRLAMYRVQPAWQLGDRGIMDRARCRAIHFRTSLFPLASQQVEPRAAHTLSASPACVSQISPLAVLVEVCCILIVYCT